MPGRHSGPRHELAGAVVDGNRHPIDRGHEGVEVAVGIYICCHHGIGHPDAHVARPRAGGGEGGSAVVEADAQAALVGDAEDVLIAVAVHIGRRHAVGTRAEGHRGRVGQEGRSRRRCCQEVVGIGHSTHARHAAQGG